MRNDVIISDLNESKRDDDGEEEEEHGIVLYSFSHSLSLSDQIDAILEAIQSGIATMSICLSICPHAFCLVNVERSVRHIYIHLCEGIKAISSVDVEKRISRLQI